VLAESVAPSGKHRAVRPPAALPVANFIDSYIVAKLNKAGVTPASRAGDEEFLRRVTLDLTGAIPDASEVGAFAADATADKRARKIDQLLASDAFVDRWTMWFGDLVQNVEFASNIFLFYNGRNAYHAWIRDSFRGGKPYDQMVRELLSGSGDSVSGPSPNYVARQFSTGPPQDLYDNLAAHAGQKFLAMPLLCISCHDGRGHLEGVNGYLRERTRREFWQTAAFFSRTELTVKNSNDPLGPFGVVSTYFIRDNDTGRYDLGTIDGNKSPRTVPGGQTPYVLPAFVLTGEAPRSGEPYRAAFARMLTGNRQFARATVNYLWKEMFGIGIVEPSDAFDLSRLDAQPTHPELLESLTDAFITGGYDIRALLRLIATSNTYQLSAQYTPGAWNEAWVPLYARHYPRRLPAEMVFDEIAKSTGVVPSIDVRGTTAVARAMQLPDPTEPDAKSSIGRFLNQFGRGNRDDSPRTAEGSLLQALAIMNDSIVTTGVLRTTPGSLVGKVVASTNDPGSVADEIYLATLSRRPTTAERQIAVGELAAGPIGDRAEDLQYALITSLEFLCH
jgi:uncharacterized protein DUF1549/uncharacterized protein DUF1553